MGLRFNFQGESMKMAKIENDIRIFSMMSELERPLVKYIKKGDGDLVKPFYDVNEFPDASVVDITLINFIKFISTTFGNHYLDEAVLILQEIQDDGDTRKIFKFRSTHPLYVSGNSNYQNACLISGMIFLGIPIEGYFDGERLTIY